MELQVEGRNLDVRKSWQERIEEETKRLERHHAGLVRHLRVSVEDTSSHKEGGYEVLLVASVPNDTVVVKRKGDGVKPLLVDAFDTLGLQLKELQRKRRQTHKPQEGENPANEAGVVKTIFPGERYGFIFTPAGEEVYFHANALKDVELDELCEGDAVRFGLAEGEKGPRAVWVRNAR